MRVSYVSVHPSVRMFYLRIIGRFSVEFSTRVSAGGAAGGRF